MFVALVQQGMVLGQKIIAVGDDREELQKHAEAEAEKLNAGAQMTEGYVGVVLEWPLTELCRFWPVQATAGDVRAVMAAQSTLSLPEPAAKVIAALAVAVGDVDHEPGVNPPDDARLEIVAPPTQ